MKVLIGCEFSGVGRRAFRAVGCDAWSCDLLPAEDGSPYHIQGDVLGVLDQGWDLMIGHPPCTFLSNSGVSHLYKPGTRWKDLIAGAVFFRQLLNAPIDHVCIENPVMHKYAASIIGRRQDQTIQPYDHGHPESKRTALWLRGLPLLKPSQDVKADYLKAPANIGQRLHYLPPSPDRWKIRSTTFSGIAKAMADQWGQL